MYIYMLKELFIMNRGAIPRGLAAGRFIYIVG
jgi:hypothetical protein